jgi:hypothetical protein
MEKMSKDQRLRRLPVGALLGIDADQFFAALPASGNRLTGKRSKLSTVAYMSPEQVRGKELDAR